jgi:hypothetical protein
MARYFPSLLTAALACLSTVAAAQNLTPQGPVPKPPVLPGTQPTKEQIEDAAFEMRVLIGAMNSDKVDAPIKDALFECLYQNNFAKISDAISKVIAQNPDKVAKRNPDQILGVMAGVCGYRPKAPAAGATPAPAAPTKPAPAAPAKPGAKPQGR